MDDLLTTASTNVQAGRDAVDAYRETHRRLHEKGWHNGTAAAHTPLLGTLVAALEQNGFVSSETDAGKKREETLASLWKASDEQNVKELGFINKKDFDEKASKADREVLKSKWR